MNKNLIKQVSVYAGIVLLFLILAYGFVPGVLQGKVVNQSDISAWQGMTHEILEHNAAHPDDPTLWTNSMFGGMPVVTMFDKFDGDWTNAIYKLLMWGKRPATYLFVALLGAFLLMLSMGVGKFLAVAGAIAVAFCSYNLQIIQVGHNTKMQAIAFFPWVLAGLILTYRKAMESDKGDAKIPSWLSKAALGSVLFAFALSMQIKANHPQITWYLATCVVLYAFVLFISVLIKKDGRKDALVRFFSASALLLVVGIIGIATNANKLIPTMRYSKHTMRGGSELKAENGGQDRNGLDIAYATQWSYGIGEMPNLLIPNYNGGASSGKLSKDSASAKVLKSYGYSGKDLNQTLKYMPLYWGPQPFTAGPMYIGAISVFLFILGLCLFKGKEKWWLLAASVFAILLSWGCNFEWFTRLCFNVLPMYNKFRTVSMSLIVLQVTFPLLGFVVLDRIFKGEYNARDFKRGFLTALGITAGFCVLCVIIPGIAGDFGRAESQYPKELTDALCADRRALLVHDAIRSIGAILLTATAVYVAFTKPDKTKYAGAAICLLVLLDLGVVGKRYLNASHFMDKKQFQSQYPERDADTFILEDEDPDFRVLDLSVNTFNDAHTSYYHKSIGGYSPAKMQRYQDLIDRYISKEINAIVNVANEGRTLQSVEENMPHTPVLDMLNCKYIILQDNLPPVMNDHAQGACWLVENAVNAASANEEITLLGKADLRKSAIIRDWSRTLPEVESAPVEDIFAEGRLDDIRLTSYAANELHYSYAVSQDRLAVFSEIWYPDWKVTIIPEGGEAQEGELLRADWVLRAAVIPQGEGEIVMRFEPASYKNGEGISRASSIILILLLLLSVGAPAVLSKVANSKQ